MFTYTQEQQTCIDTFMEALDRDMKDKSFYQFMLIEKNGVLCQRGEDLFAIFSSIAFKLFHTTLEDEGSLFEFKPVLVQGLCIAQFPDEGSSGVLHLMRCLKRRGKIKELPTWQACFLPCSWLHTEELNQSSRQILDNISDEVDLGETPLTGY